jgi:hypothetical protein
MARRKSVRSQLCRAARDLGNVEAVKNGGVEGLAKRDARRAAYRKSNSLTNSLLRGFGLSGHPPKPVGVRSAYGRKLEVSDEECVCRRWES